MSELKTSEETGTKTTGPDMDSDLDPQTENELRPIQPGLRERIRKLLNNAPQGGLGRKQELAKDRTRSFVLLIGGTVGAAHRTVLDARGPKNGRSCSPEPGKGNLATSTLRIPNFGDAALNCGCGNR